MVSSLIKLSFIIFMIGLEIKSIEIYLNPAYVLNDSNGSQEKPYNTFLQIISYHHDKNEIFIYILNNMTINYQIDIPNTIKNMNLKYNYNKFKNFLDQILNMLLKSYLRKMELFI